VGLDFKDDPDLLQPNYRMEKQSDTTVTDLVKWFETFDNYGTTNYYAYGDTGKIYAQEGANPWTVKKSVTVSHGQGMSVFHETKTMNSGSLVIGRKYKITTYNASDDFTNVGAASNTLNIIFVATGTTPANWAASSVLTYLEDALYYARDAYLGKYFDLGGTPTFNDTFQTLNPDLNWHPTKVFFDRLCVGNGNTLATLEIDGTWTPAAVTLPPGWKIKCLEIKGDFLYISPAFAHNSQSF